MIEHLRKISYLFAYAVATIPLWHYIRDGRILAGMIAVVMFAYVMVVLNSVQAAQPILSSEKAKTALPRWLPDRSKYHKWWMIIRRTLKWHLLLVPPKMGLALGFVHQLFFSRLAIPGGRAYNYISHNFGNYSLHLIPEVYPQFIFVCFAFITLIIFSIFEAALLASLIIKTGKYDALYRKSLIMITLRVFIALGFVGIVELATDSQHNSSNTYSLPCIHTVVYENGSPVYIDEEWQIYKLTVYDSIGCLRLRVFETVTNKFDNTFCTGNITISKYHASSS